MSWEKMCRTVELCEEFLKGSKMRPCFFLTGGDPLLHPDFWKLEDLLHRKQIPFTILGNPFHLSKDECKKLKKMGCQRYQLSLDGLEETHDWFRKPGSYKETMEKIRLLEKTACPSLS